MPKRSPPATREDVTRLKEDIRLLAEQFGNYQSLAERRIAESVDRLTRHFDVAVEQIRNDVAGANTDEILMLEDRVTRLECHVGLANA